MPPKLKRSIGKGAPIDKYLDGLDSVSLQRYKEKIQLCGGMNPFTLLSTAMSSDPAHFPDLKRENIVNYFTKCCHVSGQQLNVQRGIQSFELAVVGYVSSIESFFIEASKMFIVRGKVNFVQDSYIILECT
jgi:hypothetical protein